MRHRGPIPLGFLLLLFYIYQSADARKCNLNCAGTTGNLLKFHPGKTYRYKLEGHSVTTLPGAKGEASKVDLEANVEVSATRGCEHVLAVSGVHTTSSDGKKYNLDSTLGSHPLKFAFQNGKVVDLCTSETESTTALNVKRAVLSLLQSSVLKESGYAFQHETDVFGNCPTNFEFLKHGSSVVVRKTKDLTKCAHREHLNLPFSTSSYFVPSDLQTSPLLSGLLNTEQKLEGGLLKYASSEEVYNYNPLSAAESATKVQVNTKLTYVDHSDKPAPLVSANSGKSLVFQEDHPEVENGGVGTMVELLRGSCDSRTVNDDGASKFSSLVRVMSNSPKEELLQVYQQVKSGQGFKEKDVAKKMYMDALVQANSASSVEVMAELLKHKEVTGSKAQYFYLLLGSVKHATRAALLAVTPLLDDDVHPALYLGAGALGGRFCREHNCAKFPEVEAFQTKLAAPLLTKGCKPPNKKEEDVLLASLKGLANMKYLTKPVATKLADYATDLDVKARVRVALLETMRSDANKLEFKTVAGEVFKNPLEDSEVRIKAYLVLAECPCGKVAALVKTVLESEKSYQVGGFVTSHLRNLRASTNPEKAHAKHHLGAVLNTEKYPVDFRKYSQNFEQSYSADLLNLGASAESNVIYSQQSYVPRSVSLNLTSYMFGHAMNWFEVNVRTENLERELERVFGPRGKLRKQKYHEVYEEGREYATSLLETAAERYEKSFRPKRSVTRDQLNALANKVDLHRESDDDVDVDVSLKLYGNELFWVKYHGDESRPDLGEGVNKLFEGLDDSLNSAKDLNFDYRKHVTFMDEEVVYPTGLGLPLKLRALGSTAFRLKLDGKFDVAALLKDPKNTDVRLQVLPSAAVEVRGDFVLDGVAFEGGVKVALNLHTSTGSDLTFRVLEGRGVDVKFGLPVKKQDVLSVTTDVATVVKKKNSPEHAVPVVFDVKREKYNGCFDQLNTVLGVTVCGEMDVPWEGHRSLLPSYGPSKLFLHIDKDDDSLTYYHFKVYADEREGVGTFELLFDTPNSRENRKVSLHVEGSLEKTYLKMDLKSPWTSALFDAALVFTKKELSLNVKFVQNEVEYFLRTGAVKSHQGNVVKFEPVLEYKAPEQTRSALVGRRGGPKHSSQVVTLTGAVFVETHDNEKTWKFEKLALNTPRTEYSVDGTGSTTPHGVDLDVVVHYDKEHVKVKGNFKRKDKNGYNQLMVLPSQYPDFNLNVKWEYYYDPSNGKYESQLNATHGPDPNSATNMISVHNKLELNRKENVYGTENTVTYPLVNLDGHVGFRFTEKSLKTELRGKFDRYSAQLLVQGEVNTKKEGDYNAEMRWELMGNSVGLTLSRKVLKNHQSKFVNVLDVKPGGRYELRVHATHKHNKNDLDYSADVDLLLPADPKTVKLKGGFKHNNLETKGHLNALAGNKQYLQSDFNLKPGDKSPSGAFKLKVPEYVLAQGDFVFDGTNFNAKSKLELPKVQRQLEGKANFVVTNSKFSGSAELCWETGTPEKTFMFQTDTSLQETTVDSKNVLVFAGKTTVLNLKGFQTGDEEKNNFAGELELVLPNGNRVLLVGRENYDFVNSHDASGEGVVELLVQESGKEPLKVTLKGVGKNMDFERLNFDGQFNVHFTNPDNKDLTSHLVLKKSPKGDDKWLVKGEFAASGSLLDKPVTLTLDSEVPTELFDDDSKNLDNLPPLNYHFTLTAGSDVYLESNGKVGGNVLAGDLTAKLPHDLPVTSVKWTTSNFLDLFNKNNKYKVKSSNELHWNNDNFVKVSGEANCEPNGLNYVAEWETNKLSKRKLSGSAHWFEDKNTKKADGNAVLLWEGKTADLSVKAERSNENFGTFHLVGNTPEQGKVDLQLKNKVVKNGKGLHSELVLLTKDKKVAVLSKVELDPKHPLFDLVVDHPDGKTKFLWKVDNKGEKHWASEVKAKWTGHRSGSFALDSEVMLKSIDNFLIKHNLEVPLQGGRKFNVELSNRPGREEGKKITFTFKRDEKLMVSASSNYVVREDGNEKVLEGNGNLKIDDQQFPLNFKGTWICTENERAAKLLVKSGKRSVALEYQHNDNEFNLERTLCNSQGKCSKAQLLNKVKLSGFDEYEHTVVFAADLHVLDQSLPDVSYVGSYKRKGQTVDHLIEAKVFDQVKFKYLAYVHDKETGFFVTLPKRTVGAELKYDVENKNSGGSSKLEANLYFNKEKNDKLCLTVNSDVAKTKDTLKVTGEAKLTHPSLKKDLFVKGHYESHVLDLNADLVLDIFNNENEKVVLSLKSNTVKDNVKLKSETMVAVKSDACKLNVLYDSRTVLDEGGHFSYEEKFSYVDSHGVTKESKAQYKVSPQRAYMLLTLPGVKLLELDVKVETKGKELLLTGDYSLGSRKATESLHYNSELNHALYDFKYDGNVLKAEVGLLMRKSATFNFAFNDKLASQLEFALDETNFLKTNYNYDPEVVKNFWTSLGESLQADVDEVRNLLVDAYKKEQPEMNHFVKCLTQCLPDFTGLLNHVEGELKHLKEEALADSEVSNVVNHLRESFGTLFEYVSVFAKEFNEFLQTVGSLVREHVDKMTEVLNEVAPKLTDAFNRLTEVVASLLEQYVKVCVGLLEEVMDELKKYKEDVDAFTKVFTDLLHEVGKQFAKVLLVVHDEVNKFVELNLEQLKELPVTNMLKEKLQEFKDLSLPDEAWMVYAELVDNVKVFLPTTECEDFVSTLSTYVTKVLKQEPVDSAEAGKELYEKLVLAVKSLLTKLNEVAPDQGVFKPEKYLSLPLVSLVTLPTGSVRWSTLNFLRSNDFPALVGSLETFAPSLNVLDNFPPFLAYAQLIDSTEVVTFDGRHYTVRGLCSYVLAEDYVDRNFSVVGHFKEGKLEAVTAFDDNHSVTLRNNAAPLKDGLEAEYPLKVGHLKAWKTPNSVGFRMKAGVVLFCTSTLDSCVLQVSGFYFNKLRGLFGNLNYERYDDLVLPQGTVGNDAAQFCNSWKVENACPDVPATPQTHQRQSECTEMFASDDSDLVLGRPWLPLGQYRDACDHLVAAAPTADKKAMACKVAMSYVFVAQKKGALLLDLPSKCVVCEVNNKKVGDEESTVVTPGKAADVVVLVDVLKKNEETYKHLVQPLVPQLRAELQKNGINDVHVTLVSFNSPTNRWTNYHSANGKLEFNGHDCLLEFEKKPEPRLETWLDRLLDSKNQLFKELGSTQQSKAYEDLLDYHNFRPHALKTVVAVHSEPCPTGSFLNFFIPVRTLVQSFRTLNQGVVWNLVTPVNGLATDLKDGVTNKDVVGFTDEELYTLSKGTVKGDVNFDSDYCLPAVHATGGVVFPTYNFREFNKEGKGAAFTQKTAELVVKSLLNAKHPLVCECSLTDGVLPRPDCEVED